MGDEISVEKIEVVGDLYQIDFRNERTGVSERAFILKEALFALLTVAEKESREELDKRNISPVKGGE